MVTETKVKCVCGRCLMIVNSSADQTTWCACAICDRSTLPYDIGISGNTVIEKFKEKYQEEYEALPDECNP